MRKFIDNRKGSAIAFALFIATVLLLSEAFLLNQNRNNIISKKKNTEDMQSYFAARAAMQHVMLKAQILPTQLYDAACISVGRNPHFDFSQYASKPADIFPSKYFSNEKVYIKKASGYNPGPRFLVNGSLGVTNTLKDWMTPPKNSKLNNSCEYLKQFCSDIIFDSQNYPEMNYPYSFSYEVATFTVLAIEGQRIYNEEAIKATVVGRWHPDKDKIKESIDYTITSVVRIKRND